MHRFFGPGMVLLLLAFGAIPSEAQERIFVQFQEPGLAGDSTDPDHIDWIEVIALDHGISRSVFLQNGIPQIGPASFNEISLLKAIDKVSPLIQNRLATINDVFIEVCRPTVPQECYLRFELKTVEIIDVTAVESTCLDPAACEPDHVESFSMNFQEIRWIYTLFDGKGGQQIFETSWNLGTGGA